MAYKTYWTTISGEKKWNGYGGRGAKQKMLKALRILNMGVSPQDKGYFTFCRCDGVYYFTMSRQYWNE